MCLTRPRLFSDDTEGSGPHTRIERAQLAVDTCRMAKKPETPNLINWKVYKIANKLVWLGDVEAPDEAAAVDKARKNSRCRQPVDGVEAMTGPRYVLVEC